MSEVKHYDEEPFRFRFIPAGEPSKGDLYVQHPELSPYSQRVNLTNPNALRRYARNAAEQRGFDEEALRDALLEVATIRHEEVTAAIEAEEDSGDANGVVNGQSSSDADVLVGYAEDVQLSHTPEEKTHATIQVGEHRETWPVESRWFRQWLRRRFYEDVGKAPGGTALQSAVDTIAARALFDGHEEPVFMRVAGHDGAVYVDLCNEAWEAVEITLSGWRVVGEPPVKFVRSASSAPLPYPESGGSVDALRPFLNLANDRDFRLTIGWCLGAFKPTGPYPILEIVGEQGTAKSTTARLLRSLVDPATPPLRSLPRSERDLVIAASRSWVLAFDNLSYVKPDLSDAMCRLATGGGFGTRTLYTDDEETIFEATRPQMVNGINTIALRGDLQERALSITLSPIPPEDRRRESEFWESFEAVRAKILGALCSAVSGALREVENVDLDTLPRMADSAAWVTAAEGSLGWEPGSFTETYSENRLSATASALEGDPVAVAVRQLLQHQDNDGGWSGTAQELLGGLNYLTDEEVRRSKAWPKAANALSRTMNRLAPLLRESGIEYTESEEGHDRTRVKTLRLIGGEDDEVQTEDARTEEPEDYLAEEDDTVDDFDFGPPS